MENIYYSIIEEDCSQQNRKLKFHSTKLKRSCSLMHVTIYVMILALRFFLFAECNHPPFFVHRSLMLQKKLFFSMPKRPSGMAVGSSPNWAVKGFFDHL